MEHEHLSAHPLHRPRHQDPCIGFPVRRRRPVPPPGRCPLPAPRAPSFLFFPVLTPHHLLPLASLYRKPPGRRRPGWVSTAPSCKPLHRPDHLRPRVAPASSSPPLVLWPPPPWPPAPPVRLPRELQRRHTSTARIRRLTILEPRRVPGTVVPSPTLPRAGVDPAERLFC